MKSEWRNAEVIFMVRMDVDARVARCSEATRETR